MDKTNEIVTYALESMVRYFEQFKKDLLQYFWGCLHTLWMNEGTNGVPDGYAETVFTNHLPGKSGSVFVCENPKGLIHMLFGDYGNNWEEFTPPSDSAYPGCRYFKVEIPEVGMLGAERIDDVISRISPKTFVEIQTSHAGKLELVATNNYSKPMANSVTLITEKLGKDDIMTTIYPGEPTPRGDVDPAEIKEKFGMDLRSGDLIQLCRAKEYGFKTVKYA